MEIYKSYSVLIVGDNGDRGTGLLLYHEGQDMFHVITCAHVIRSTEKVVIHLLIRQNAGDPREEQIEVSKEQFHFLSPEEDRAYGTSQIENDLAVVECKIGRLHIPSTSFAFYPMKEREEIITIGYPDRLAGEPLYYQQDDVTGTVSRVLEGQPFFIIRIEETVQNNADRPIELKGLSGAPVWEAKGLNEGKYLLGGIISSGIKQSISRGRVRVISARRVQLFLHDILGISVDSELPGTREDEIAPGYDSYQDMVMVRGGWIENSKREIKGYIEDLKLQKAIDVCNETIRNNDFSTCSQEQKRDIYSLLQQALRYGRKYEEYDKVTEEMHRQGIQNDREYLTNAIRYYEAEDNRKALEYIQMAIKVNPAGNEERVCLAVIQAALEKDASVSILSTLIGERDQLLFRPKDSKEEEGAYQVLGFAFVFRFGDTRRAIRCLNRAYQIGGSYVTLESLANVYSIQATSGRVIDTKSLAKARDAYIRILTTADDLARSGLFSRCGMLIYRCFYLANDRYRVIRHYKDLVESYQFRAGEKREAQIEYLKIAVLRGHVDLRKFDALTRRDREYFELNQLLDNPEINIQTEEELISYLTEIERRIQRIEEEKQDYGLEGVHLKMVSLYGRGVQEYHWNAVSEVRRHSEELIDPENKEYCSLLIQEYEEMDFQELEKRYKTLYEEKRNNRSFKELLNFYVRHQKFTKAKELYDHVVFNEPMPDEMEEDLLYREYLHFHLEYGLSLKHVIKHFVEHKGWIKDVYIRLFYQLSLNCATGCFNNPDEMLEDAKELFEQGVIGEREYYEKSLAILMYNMRIDDIERIIDHTHENRRIATPMEARYFVLRKYWVKENPYWEKMSQWTPEMLFEIYNEEAWNRTATEIFNEYRTNERKEIVADFWTIYYLLLIRGQEVLSFFDKIYITHFSIEKAMKEMENVNDSLIRRALYHLTVEKNVILRSPTIEEQAELFDEEAFTETICTLMLAEVVNCPAIVGEFRNEIPEKYKSRVIRPYRFPEIGRYMQGMRRIEQN